MQDIKTNVDQLLAQMEVAAENDMEANKRGKPAVMKLKMLPQVCIHPLLSYRLSGVHGVPYLSWSCISFNTCISPGITVDCDVQM